MAGDWIKIECCTPDKPEIFRMADALGCSPETVLGGMVRVWIWADQQSVNGCGLSVTKAALDRISCIAGIGEAMASVGWLDDSSGFVSIPNFERHNGKSAKKRSETNSRVAEHRKRKCNADVTELNSNSSREHIPDVLRNEIIERDGGKCVYCGRMPGQYSPGRETKDDSVLCLDHVIPVSRGGDTSKDNLVSSCRVCNSKKSNRTPDECGFVWPLDETGTQRGCNKKTVTKSVTREEKRREEKNIKKKSKKEKPTAPTIEEVTAYCKEHGFGHIAKRAFDYYDAGDWNDAKGNPVRNWKQKLQSVWFDVDKNPPPPEPEIPENYDKIIEENARGSEGGDGEETAIEAFKLYGDGLRARLERELQKDRLGNRDKLQTTEQPDRWRTEAGCPVDNVRPTWERKESSGDEHFDWDDVGADEDNVPSA